MRPANLSSELQFERISRHRSLRSRLRFSGLSAAQLEGVPSKDHWRKGPCQDSNTQLFYPTAQSYLFSLHHHFGRHLGMNRAEIAIRSRLRKLEAEPVVGVEGLGLEGTILADNGVRDVIAIYP